MRIAIAVGVALASVVLWPAIVATGAPGHGTVDIWTHAWGLGWVWDSLASGRLPTSTTQLGFPRGGTITPADPLGAVVVLPVTALSGPGAAYEVEAFVQVALAGAAGFLYGSALGGPGGGALAAVVCATSPTFTAEIHNGILEANWIGLVPLAAWMAHRGNRWTGIFVGLAAIGSPYHGVSAGVLATLHLIAAGRVREVPRMLAHSLVGALPAFMALRAGLGGMDPLEIKPPGIQEPTLRINAIDPRAFFVPGDWWTVRLETPDHPNFRRTPYLGAVLLFAAAFGLRRRPWLLAPVIVGSLLALGPYLWWNGDWLRTASGGRYALPLLPLLHLTSLDHPLRFLGMGIVALAGLAAALGRWGALAAVAVLFENLLVAPNVWPIATSDMDLPAVYAELPADGRAVVDLPAEIGDSMTTGRYVYWAGLHGHPVPYTLKPSSRVPCMNPALRTWLAIGTNRPIPPGSPGWIDPAADLGAAVGELVDLGFGWVVLHLDLAERGPYEAVLSRTLGMGRQVADTVVWEIRSPSTPPTPPPPPG